MVRTDSGDDQGHAGEASTDLAGCADPLRRELPAEARRVLDLGQRLCRAQTLATAAKVGSSLAHEMGTPLHVIAMQVEVLLRQAPPALRGGLELIARQLDSISKIIRGVLEAVRTAPDVKTTEVAATLELLRPLLEQTVKRREVALALTAEPDLPLVLADPGQLQQVVLNLVLNAIEAVPAGGRVEVRVFRSAGARGPGVGIAVTDNGPGIPAVIQPHIFDPFFTTKPRGQRTGLGLAICRDIVTECGGEIRLESREGAGATFTIYLPEEKMWNGNRADPGR